MSADGNGGGSIFSLVSSWATVSFVILACLVDVAVGIDALFCMHWFSLAEFVFAWWILAVDDVLWLEKNRFMADIQRKHLTNYGIDTDIDIEQRYLD